MGFYEKYRKPVALCLGLASVFTYLYSAFQMTREPDEILVNNQYDNAIQVYLIDEERDLIPFTVLTNDIADPKDNIKEALNYMIYGNFLTSVASGILPKQTIVEDVIIENGTVQLHFNPELLSYDPKDELRLLEAITYTATQYDHQANVEIYINQKKLDRLPQYQTAIPNPLTREIGINNFEVLQGNLHDSIPVTICYTKEKEDSLYYVLKTIRTQKEDTMLNTMIQSMIEDISVSSLLTQPIHQEGVRNIEVVSLEDDVLTLDVDRQFLSEEKTAREHLLNTLMISLKESTSIEVLILQSEKEILSVSGSNEEPILLSDVSYNSIILSNP